MREYKEVSDLLHEEGILHEPAESYVALIEVSRKGLDAEGLSSLQDYLRISKTEIIKLMDMSTSTFQRRLSSQKLSPTESEHLIQIYKLITKGLQVFGDKEQLLTWIKSENQALGGVAPLDLMQSQLGIYEVEQQLGRLAYGIYA